MTSPERAHLDPYRAALAKYGASFETTLWRSREAQQKRFDAMIGMVNFEFMTVLDAGCGLADFAARMIERGVVYRNYIGIDALEEMVEACEYRGLPRTTFRLADFATELGVFAEIEHDYAVFSGSLNTMTEPHAREVIDTAFKHAKRGVVFNFLSNHPHPKWQHADLGPARRFDTIAWFQWALDLTPFVKFNQAYLEGHDATIVLEREEAG